MNTRLPANVIPQWDPVSTVPPTAEDERCTETLASYLEQLSPLEDDEGRSLRERVLLKIKGWIKGWVREETILRLGVSEEEAEDAGGELFISGSYRLGVNGKGADIDVICCVPKQCQPEGFFGSFKEKIETRPDVANLVAIPDAAVPMIGLQVDGVEIDLLLAVLPHPKVDIDYDKLLDDEVLRGVDDATAKSLNGPRVTELMYRMAEHNIDNFKICLRCVRVWAKRRGIYSNKLGYLGGVNYAILVTLAVQLYPHASADKLLQYVFEIVLTWCWPTEIRLTRQYEPGLNMEQWDAAVNIRNKRDIMPIITPAYPVMNSSYSTNFSTKDVMLLEFERARHVTRTAAAETRALLAQGKSPSDARVQEVWAKLFSPVNFFTNFSYYIAVDIFAANEKEHKEWEGWVESRIRHLVVGLARLPLSQIRPHPKVFSQTVSEEKDGSCIFVGIEVDKQRIHGKRLDFGQALQTFEQRFLGQFRGYKVGMEIQCSALKWKNLPDFCLEDCGGRVAAAALRKQFKKASKELEAKAEAEAKEAAEKMRATTTWTKDSGVDSVEQEEGVETTAGEVEGLLDQRKEQQELTKRVDQGKEEVEGVKGVAADEDKDKIKARLAELAAIDLEKEKQREMEMQREEEEGETYDMMAMAGKRKRKKKPNKKKKKKKVMTTAFAVE